MQDSLPRAPYARTPINYLVDYARDYHSPLAWDPQPTLPQDMLAAGGDKIQSNIFSSVVYVCYVGVSAMGHCGMITWE